MTVHAAYAYDKGQTPSNDSFFADHDRAEDFQFKSGFQLQTGRQRVDQSGVLFANSVEDARGASLSDSAERYRLQLFGYQMQPTVRYDGLSVNYIPTKYSSGASLQLNDMQQWKVQSAFFTSNESMSGLYGPETSTWNISADRQWMKDSLHSRIEYARSQNDDYDTGGYTGHAIDLRLDTLAVEWIQLPLLDLWNAGARYRSIDAGYYPATDIYLQSGLDEANVFFKSSIKHFTFDIGWREQDQQAIEAIAQLARSESRSMASVKYSPDFDEDNFFRRLLGAPSLTAHYHKVEAIVPGFDTSGRVLNPSLPSQMDEQGLTLLLSRPLWHWSVQYQESYRYPRNDNQDFGVTNGDRNSTFFSVGLTPFQNVVITANAQWHRQLVTGTPNGNNQQLYNVAANFDLIPNACSFSMQYDYAQSQGAVFNGSNLNWGMRNQVGSAALSWRGITLKGSRPIMDLSLRSSYGVLGDPFAMVVDKRWSAQLSMNMYLGERI
jgi:hypothetical protein